MTYREVTVQFTIPGPAGTYSSVSVGHTVGKDCEENEVADLYLEAEAGAMSNLDKAYKKLLTLYRKIHGPDET